jgi:hypothetical protein
MMLVSRKDDDSLSSPAEGRPWVAVGLELPGARARMPCGSNSQSAEDAWATSMKPGNMQQATGSVGAVGSAPGKAVY